MASRRPYNDCELNRATRMHMFEISKCPPAKIREGPDARELVRPPSCCLVSDLLILSKQKAPDKEAAQQQ